MWPSLPIRFDWSRREPKVKGGIHPESRKAETAEQPIALDFPLPERLYIPLQQHIGQPADPVVKVGQKVLKGERIAASQGAVSAPLHAPTSGAILDIMEFSAPHPSVLTTPTIVLEPDGEQRWIERPETADPFSLEPEEICARVGTAGIVGMGGAAFPAVVKLNLGRKSKIHTLLINGGECEPYLSCDDRLMRERAESVVDGIRIMLHGMVCGKAIVAIEDNKPEAYRAIVEAARPFGSIEVALVPSLYPMGWDKQMVRFLTGKEVPAGGLPTDVGVLLHNVATAYVVHEAIRHGTPLISRIVTVSGGAVGRPQNVEAPLGTLLSELLAFCDHDPWQAARYVMGGPMMGNALPHARVPLVKGASGILALTQAELPGSDAQPCIRCSRCVSACPAGLLPLEMAARIRAGQLDAALGYGLKDCINCGSCSYVCPSKIPLVHYFKYANGELVARQQAKHKAEQIKRLVIDRQGRLERIRAALAAAEADDAPASKTEQAA